MSKVHTHTVFQIVSLLSVLVVASWMLASCAAPTDGSMSPAPTSVPAVGAARTEESAGDDPTDATEATEEPPVPFPGTQIPAIPPASIADIIEAELAKLQPGRILFNPPVEMSEGVSERVEVRVTRNLTDTAMLESGLQGRGPSRIENVKVGTFMRARLTGENFEIEALNSEDQVVGSEDFTQWAWAVTPTWHGTQKLRLAVTVRVNVNGTEEVRDLPVKEETITVAVNPVYTAMSLGRAYWPPVVALLLIAIGLSAARLFATRQRTPRPLAAPQTAHPTGSPPGDTLLYSRRDDTDASPGVQLAAQEPLVAPVPDAPEVPTRYEPGALIHDRYQIVRLIGTGGMGAVYEAVDQRLNNTVALKQMLLAGDELDTAFQREARILAHLRHPALPKVIDYFRDRKTRFLVMEFFEGPDLAALLAQRSAPFSVEEVLAWADQLLQALDYLHTQTPPVVHRDIKPQNLKLTASNQIVLLDFGLAKGGELLQSQVAGAKSVFGYTPQYAPPEQIEGSGTEARSDLYALAATLHHLLTRAPLPTALTRLAAHRNEQPDPLRPVQELNPQVPTEVGAVLVQALSLNINARPASATEMRTQLQQAARHRAAAEDSKKTVIVEAPTVPGNQGGDAQDEG